MRVVVTLVPAVVAIVILAAYFSTSETRHRCTGTLSFGGSETPETIFVRQQSYRWWTKLWGDSAGSFWIEVPNRTVAYYEQVTRAGDLLQINSGSEGFSGTYSHLSRALTVSIRGLGIFSGSCDELAS